MRKSLTGNYQLEHWISALGNNYTRRNLPSAWKVRTGVRAYRRIFTNLKISSVLEVGCSIGLNLLILDKIYKGKIKLYAVEPNKKAFNFLTKRDYIKLAGAWLTDAVQIPLTDNSIDLVFTSGVLIHIAPKNLLETTREIVRVAKGFVLCIEYFSHEPVEVKYRGYKNLLFKRDFGAFYLDNFPNLKIVDYGFFWQRELPIFDNLNWWLFEKEQHRR